MILASLCMREGSVGVPNKNIININGKETFRYTLERALESNFVDDIVISTNSQKIINLSNNYIDPKSIFLRSESLSKSNSSKWDVFRDLILQYENRFKTKIDYLIDLDVTVPQKKTEHIDGVIKELVKKNFDCVITGYEADRNPYFNMMEKNLNGFFEVCKKNKNPILNRQNSPEVLSLSPSVFGMERNSIFEHSHWSQTKCNIFKIPRKFGIDIDDELDLLIVEEIIKDEKKKCFNNRS